MAITHVTAVRNSLAGVISAAADAGAGAALIVLRTAANAEVATLTMSATAFGAAASGVITANAITSDTNATGGTVANFILTDSNSNEVYSGTVTVTGGGGDLELSSLAIGAGDTVSISTWEYTASL